MPPTEILPENPNPRIDWQVALANVDGDEDLLGELVVCFTEEVPRHLADMRKSIMEGDARALRVLASTLQGNLAFFGLTAIAKTVADLKMRAHNKDLAECPKRFAEIEAWLATILQQASQRAAEVEQRFERLLEQARSAIEAGDTVLATGLLRRCREHARWIERPDVLELWQRLRASDYTSVIRQLPPPTVAQTERFARYVARRTVGTNISRFGPRSRLSSTWIPVRA